MARDALDPVSDFSELFGFQTLLQNRGPDLLLIGNHEGGISKYPLYDILSPIEFLSILDVLELYYEYEKNFHLFFSNTTNC